MYSIREVGEMLLISVYTLRYYDNQNLFPYVSRDKNNNRQFSDEDIKWVTMVKTLRTTGMPLAQVKYYIKLCQMGNSTIKERAEIIRNQRISAEHELGELHKKITILKNKEAYYTDLCQHGEDDYWNPDSD